MTKRSSLVIPPPLAEVSTAAVDIGVRPSNSRSCSRVLQDGPCPLIRTRNPPRLTFKCETTRCLYTLRLRPKDGPWAKWLAKLRNSFAPGRRDEGRPVVAH